MRHRIWALIAVGMLLFQQAGFCDTIVAHELEKYFYQDGKMERYEGQYENTYFFDPDKNQLVRTRIYDFQTKEITPDNTVYEVQNQLLSYPKNAARFGRLPEIRAFAQTGKDTTEMIAITDEYVYTASSELNRLVVSRSKRLR